MKLIDDWKESWKYATNQISFWWATACTVFVALPREQQVDMIGLLGIDGAGALAAFTFFAQVSAAVAATTILARVTQFREPTTPKE